MFCHKCGTQIGEGSQFCHKCGTKVLHEDVSPINVELGKANEPTADLNSERHEDFIDLVISCAKFKGYFPGTIFAVLIDGIQVGELPNGGIFEHKIRSGKHCVMIGQGSIGIDVPEDAPSVALRLEYDGIVCSQSHFVTEAPTIEKVTVQSFVKDLKTGAVGLVLALVGVAGFIFAGMIEINHGTVDYVMAIFVSSLLCGGSGAAFMILSPKSQKKKLKRIVLGAISIIAIGALIALVSAVIGLFY